MIEPTSVELHQTGAFEGRSIDWVTAPRPYTLYNHNLLVILEFYVRQMLLLHLVAISRKKGRNLTGVEPTTVRLKGFCCFSQPLHSSRASFVRPKVSAPASSSDGLDDKRGRGRGQWKRFFKEPEAASMKQTRQWAAERSQFKGSQKISSSKNKTYFDVIRFFIQFF